MEALKQAVRNIKTISHPDENNKGFVVGIKPKEAGGYPPWAFLKAISSVTFEQGHNQGHKMSLMASVTTRSILNPKNDLSFELGFAHSYLDDVKNPRNRILKTSFFNSRKQSFEEVVPSMLNRSGLKANITEDFTREVKFIYGLKLEEITTTQSIDRIASLHANITRDNTKFVNGAIVGEKDAFKVDQGFYIGSNFPVFNRHQVTSTRFIQLKQVEEGSENPQPPVLVLHGHYGRWIGDVPSYDAFVLGGPFSVRGYSMGELGVAKSILELGVEIRIPVKNTHVYAFAEHGNDLGSSKDVKGNPTAVYKRIGHGSSFGLGFKLGEVRAEYAVNHNRGTGSLVLRFGERY